MMMMITGRGQFVCSFRFALSILCFFVTMTLYAQRMGMSVAIVCMVNHTAVAKMRDAHLLTSSSSSSSGGNNVTTTTAPGDWLRNESDNLLVENIRSPCVRNLAGGGNRSGAMVTKATFLRCQCQYADLYSASPVDTPTKCARCTITVRTEMSLASNFKQLWWSSD